MVSHSESQEKGCELFNNLIFYVFALKNYAYYCQISVIVSKKHLICMGLCSGKGIANVRNSDKIGLLVLYLNKTQVLLFIFAMFDKNII